MAPTFLESVVRDKHEEALVVRRAVLMEGSTGSFGSIWKWNRIQAGVTKTAFQRS